MLVALLSLFLIDPTVHSCLATNGTYRRGSRLLDRVRYVYLCAVKCTSFFSLVCKVVFCGTGKTMWLDTNFAIASLCLLFFYFILSQIVVSRSHYCPKLFCVANRCMKFLEACWRRRWRTTRFTSLDTRVIRHSRPLLDARIPVCIRRLVLHPMPAIRLQENFVLRVRRLCATFNPCLVSNDNDARRRRRSILCAISAAGSLVSFFSSRSISFAPVRLAALYRYVDIDAGTYT